MESLLEQAPIVKADVYQLVDDIPEIQQERHLVREYAQQLLEDRRLNYERTGEISYQPVDALSTAHSVIEAGFRYGQDSPEYTQRYDGLLLDCQRYVGEWYRKKRPEYFPPVRHVFDESKEEFFSHGLSIRQMTENALVPISGDAEEEASRINERVEDATPHIIRSIGGIALTGQSVRTVSECTDNAIESFEYDMKHNREHRGYRGYVPEIRKIMIRDIKLDNDSNDRFEEQIGIPGTYITHEIFQMALAEKGINEALDMDKTALHGAQLLAQDDLLNFVEHLDDIGTREWSLGQVGQVLFMGEAVNETNPRDYSSFRSEALERQESLKNIADTVAVFVLNLAAEDFDRTKAPAHVEEFVKLQLKILGKADVLVAEQMFDAPTAMGLQQVVTLELQGRYEEAFKLEQAVMKAAPGGGACGAGSCGLESVNTSGDVGKKLMKDLKADAGDTIVKDKERACKCGKKEIVYAYNKNKVTKLCGSCGAFETKASKA